MQRPIYRDKNLQIMFAVTLTAVIGVSSITPAFPSIAKEMDIAPQAIGSLITAFSLPGVVLTPLFGVLADRLGRRKVLVPSLVLFGVAGVACAFARDFALLLLLRLLQGIGAASMATLIFTIIGDLYTGIERTTAMGYNASVVGISAAVFPAIGGALAALRWYYPFLLALCAIPVGLTVLLCLENPEPRSQQRLTQYLSDVWQIIAKPQAIGLFAISAISFVIVYGSYMTYLPLLIDGHFSPSPFAIGLIMSISSLTTALASFQLVGRLSQSHSEAALIKVACILYALALVIVPSVPDLSLMLLSAVMLGIAEGIRIATVPSLLAALSPMRQRAGLMSIYGMSLRLGQTLGPILIGGGFWISGIGGAFYAGAGLAIAMFIALLVTTDRNPPWGEKRH